MLILVYKPERYSGGSIGEQIFASEIEDMFNGFLPILVESKRELRVFSTEDELHASLRLAKDSLTKHAVICFCLPDQIPEEIKCETYLALPYFFDVFTLVEDASSPLGRWIKILKTLRGVLVTSQQMANIVSESTEMKVPVYLISSSTASGTKAEQAHYESQDRVQIPCLMYISSNDGPWHRLENPSESVIMRFGNTQWNGAPLSWSLGGMNSGNIWPIGFFPIEHWGVWAESEFASLALPVTISGRLQVSLGALGVGRNIGREVSVRIGNSTKTIVLHGSLTTYILDFEIEKPTNQIFFEGYAVDDEIDSRGQIDSRALGIGVSSVSIQLNANESFALTRRNKEKIKKTRAVPHIKGSAESTLFSRAPISMNLEIAGSIYLMEFRAIDLMFENWREIIKNYSQALGNQQDVHLLIACPYKLAKFVLPLVTQFLDRIQPISTPVHLMFSEQMESLFESLVTQENLVLIRRADGMECSLNLERFKGRCATIGPADEATNSEMSVPTYPVKTRRQLRPIMYEEILPVVFTSSYDNEELFKTFQESFHFSSGSSHFEKFEQKYIEEKSVTSYIEDFLCQIEEIRE